MGDWYETVRSSFLKGKEADLSLSPKGIASILAIREALSVPSLREAKSPEDLMAIAFSPVGGMVKGPKGRTKLLRQLMIDEMRTRGPIVKKPMTAVEALVDKVVRGPWFHGRRTYPKTGETFQVIEDRIRLGNLGEPWGLSLTADRQLLKEHFAEKSATIEAAADKMGEKRQLMQVLYNNELLKNPEYKAALTKQKAAADKFSRTSTPDLRLEVINAWEQTKRIASEVAAKSKWLKREKALTKGILNLHNKPKSFARVLPRLGGPPAEKVLPGWKGPGTEYAQEILKDTYVEALKKQPLAFRGFLKASIPEDMLKNYGPVTQERIKEYFSLMANSPEYAEQVRKQVGAGWHRVTSESEALKIYDFLAEQGRDKKLLPNWRALINQKKFNKDISEGLQQRGFKALLYSTERGGFGEYELRMLNPKDAVMMDMRSQKDKAIAKLTGATKLPDRPRSDPNLPAFPGGWKLGRQAKRLREWENFVRKYPPSLRDIYSDIDLGGLTLD